MANDSGHIFVDHETIIKIREEVDIYSKALIFLEEAKSEGGRDFDCQRYFDISETAMTNLFIENILKKLKVSKTNSRVIEYCDTI